MAVVPTRQILERAFAEGYGVAAINVVDGLSMAAVLEAAQGLDAPVIVQTSVKTVRQIGAPVLFAMWTELARSVRVPVSLHLDHCPDRAVISDCLALGWDSVLFDGSALSLAENTRLTTEVVAEAARFGALVEGELEPFKRTHEMTGDEAFEVQPLAVAVDFIERTGIDVFAPAIGNAHGLYSSEPRLDAQRVTDLVEATGIPMALHGGTGLPEEAFRDLIARGCAKVNISTALKVAYMRSGYVFMDSHPGEYDPPSLFAVQRAAVMDMAREHMTLFGSAGRAA
jgi:fructose-bisphosphate aldolase class II